MSHLSNKLLLGAMLGAMLGALADAADPPAALWSLAPLERPAVPAVTQHGWTRNPIDAFVLARLEEAGLDPAPEADRGTLLRRLTFDLTGLPSTPDELDTFLNDPAPDAYERQIKRLLSSPRYGERWAQHWLDVVRYADSEGFEYDGPSHHAWRYRDWVIAAFNADKPYRDFVAEQVAGDELVPGDLAALTATGVHRLGPVRRNAGFQYVEKERQEFLVEATDTIGNAFLGLTIGCAKCHDHMFDPFSQADYYRLQAFFAGTVAHEHSLATAAEKEAHEAATEAWTERQKELAAELAAFEAPHREAIEVERRARLPPAKRDALAKDEKQRTLEEKFLANRAQAAVKVTPADIEARLRGADVERHRALTAKVEHQDTTKPAPPAAVMTVKETLDEEPETYVLRAGIVGAREARVEPGFPAAVDTGFLASLEPPGGSANEARSAGSTAGDESQAQHGTVGRRSRLARWLVAPEHPLTARVYVNRLWQHHFRGGLVSTPGDFGHMGNEPSHPELLSWLASELLRQGGSTKALHRMIVRSAAYRQRTRVMQRDGPEDRLLAGRRRLRLDAEAIRDSALAIAGTLNLETGGPGIRMPLLEAIARQMYVGKWRPHADVSQHARRSIYRFVKRNLQPALFWAFDAPSTVVSCSQRTVSTHPGQALDLLNGPFLNQQAAAFADRLRRDVASGEPRRLVERAYLYTFGRHPTTDELQLGVDFLAAQEKLVPREQATNPDEKRRVALIDYCLTLLNLDEFLFIE